jgi:DNA polymerase III alpha subunit
MVYQEDVMKVAVALGGFSVHDGDQLRKVLSKKHKERQLRDYQRQFYAGAAVRHISRPVVDHVWAMMMSFAGYSFCKPHSCELRPGVLQIGLPAGPLSSRVPRRRHQ